MIEILPLWRFQEAMLDKKLLPFWAVHWRRPGWILPALQGVFWKDEREEHVFFLNESMIEYGCQWMSTSQNWDSFWKKEWMDLTKKSWGFQPAKNQKGVFCFAVIEMDAKNLPIRPII